MVGELRGFPGAIPEPSLVAQMVKNLPAMQETWVQSLGREDLLEKGMTTTPVFLPGEFHEQKNLAGYSTWGLKELDTTEQLTLPLCVSLESQDPSVTGSPQTSTREKPPALHQKIPHAATKTQCSPKIK